LPQPSQNRLLPVRCRPHFVQKIMATSYPVRTSCRQGLRFDRGASHWPRQ
jgi:hypothetical protein